VGAKKKKGFGENNRSIQGSKGLKWFTKNTMRARVAPAAVAVATAALVASQASGAVRSLAAIVLVADFLLPSPVKKSDGNYRPHFGSPPPSPMHDVRWDTSSPQSFQQWEQTQFQVWQRQEQRQRQQQEREVQENEAIVLGTSLKLPVTRIMGRKAAAGAASVAAAAAADASESAAAGGAIDAASSPRCRAKAAAGTKRVEVELVISATSPKHNSTVNRSFAPSAVNQLQQVQQRAFATDFGWTGDGSERPTPSMPSSSRPSLLTHRPSTPRTSSPSELVISGSCFAHGRTLRPKVPATNGISFYDLASDTSKSGVALALNSESRADAKEARLEYMRIYGYAQAQWVLPVRTGRPKGEEQATLNRNQLVHKRQNRPTAGGIDRGDPRGNQEGAVGVVVDLALTPTRPRPPSATRAGGAGMVVGNKAP
jgi:hypothetical protein